MKILLVLWTAAAIAADAEFERRFRAGLNLERHGEFAAAAHEFETILPAAEKLGGDDLALTWQNLGAVYRQLGRYADAERCYLRAVTIFEADQPRRASALAITLNNLGALDLVRNWPKRAEWYYKRGRKLDPSNAESVHGLAHAAHLQRRFSEAERLYLQAAKLAKNPLEQADISYNLAMLYNDGRSAPLLQRAAAAYEQFAPDHPKLAIIRQRDASIQVASSRSTSTTSTPALP